MRIDPLGIALVALLSAAASVAPDLALAQDNTAFAQQRFSRGSALYEQRDFAGALEEFRASLSLYASPNTRLYFARCLRELGRIDESIPEFERAMREAGDRASTDPRYADTRDAAQNEMAPLAARVGRLTITIPDAPTGLTVRVNRRDIPVGALGIAMPINPGSVEVTVLAEGFEDERREVSIEAGGEAALTVPLRRRVVITESERAPIAVHLVPPPTPPPPRRSGVPRFVPFIAFGVGAAGLISFAVTGGMAGARFDDLDQRCTGFCSPAEQGNVDGGRTLTTVANVSLGVGIAGAVTGAVLMLFRRPEESRSPPSAGIAFGGRSIALEGTF